MSHHLMFGADLVAITTLVGLFLARHGRRDLVVAFLGVNVGVLAVATVLTDSTVGAGLGLGLFGVLSIIRLRSQELTQHEIAYYFGALALGLIGGITQTVNWMAPTLMALVVAALWVGDHPWVARAPQSQLILLDRAFTRQDELKRYLEGIVGAAVLGVAVQKVDLVNDTTLVTVRHEKPAAVPTDTAVVRPWRRGAA